MGDTPREKKKKKEKKEGHEGEEVHEIRKKKLSKGSGSISLVVTDHDEENTNSNNEEHEGEHKKKKKHHHHHHHDNEDDTKENTNGEENAGEEPPSSLLKKRKKKKSEEGNDNEEGGEEGEKDKEKSKEDGLLATLEKKKKEREKKANSLRFRRSFKSNSSGGGTGTVILPKKSKSQVSNREGYSHDDLETSPRKKHASLENVGPRPALSTESGLRAEENKPDKLSRWASLKGIRDGFLRSQSEEHKRGRSFSASAFGDNDELESTANPLVALAQRQQQLEQKKEREILSESMNLDERTRMRNKVINEIINTERDYINDLTRVIKLFLEPLTKEGILTPEECKDIFSNIKLLVNVNNALLDDLWKQAKETNGEQLGQSFVLLSHYLKMYSQYCGNQKVSREAVTNALKTNNRFKAYLEKQATLPELNNLTLKDYLIKPVQRLCKYPLLLRELLKYTDETHPDYEKLKAAFENIQEAVESVNSQKQTEEEMEEVAEMLSTLIGAEKFGVQLMVPGRKFVKEGVVKTTSKDHTTTGVSHYFMFSDLLILAEDNSPASEKKKAKKAGGPVKREVTAMLPFGMCLLNEIADDEANGLSNLVEIIQSTSIFTFYFESATEKTEWTKDLKIENLNDDEDQEKEKKGSKKKHKRTTSHS